MLQLEQAQQRILARIAPLPVESELLAACAQRVLGEAVIAPHDLPLFDNSAMDGYAVRAADLAGAGPAAPKGLALRGQAAAGQVFAGTLESGQCVRVFTGSPLPAGADAVVMQEDTNVDPSAPTQPRFLTSAKPWENVRFRGEDIKAGTVAMAAGERLQAGHLALLGALGCAQVPVRRRPLVGLIATGTELREPGRSLAPGQIFESNRLTLAVLAAKAGARSISYPLVPDELHPTRAALEVAFHECDAVVTSGGVSVGEMDWVKLAFQEMGGELDFWRVAIKPGKPFALGSYHGKLLFGLPGNPVSAFVTFLLLVFPALLKFQGAAQARLPVSLGILDEPLTNHGDRRHFMRVVVDDTGRIRSAGTQASHLLHSLAAANGLVDVPPETVLAAGTTVPVLTWGD
jgi:molybdopterin molybdotransferase